MVTCMENNVPKTSIHPLSNIGDDVLKAVGIVLVETAFAVDRKLDKDEMRSIGLMLAKYSGAEPKKIFEILSIGLTQAKSGMSAPMFRAALKHKLSTAQQTLFLELVIRVALINGVIEEREELVISDISRLLSIPSGDVSKIKERVLGMG